MTNAERMAVIKKNRTQYKYGVSVDDLDGCALTGFVPEHVYDKNIIGRNSLNVACRDIDYLLTRVEELESAQKSICDAFAEWESVRTFRNDINSHEWLALVAAVTAMENSHETPTTTD